MATKFSEFLESKKIDPRRLMAVSKKIEQLRPQDRALKRVKKGGSAKEGEEGEGPAKPRSGRPVTGVLISKASQGKPISGPAKTRLLRAVNTVLEQKKQEQVTLRELF